MNAYLLIPLFALTVCTVLAVAILTSDWRLRVNQLGCLLFAGGAWWAMCEVLWNTAHDPAIALRLVRLSAIGWAGIGPLGLDVLLRLGERPHPRARAAMPWLYATSALFALIVNFTGVTHTGVMREPWGWGYELGAWFVPIYLFVFGCLAIGFGASLAAQRDSGSPVERALLRWMVIGGMLPLVVASVTDVVLPLLGIQVVRLATAAVAVLGAAVAVNIARNGHALLAPSAVAREILDTIPDGVALLTIDGRIRNVNPEMARLLNRPAAALEGVLLPERLRGRGASDAADGVDGDCTLDSFGAGAIPVSVAWRTLIDKRGLPFGRMLVARDSREVTDLRRRLVTAGRLAAVGELAAGIAHEINNPIAFIGSNMVTLREYWLELTKEQGRDTKASELLRDGEELIEECLEGIERVKLIVHDVKGFAHAGEERSFVNPNTLVDSALRVARPLLPEQARLERVLSDVPHVRASARHLQQVFLNLLTNAAQAIGPAGTIRVQTARCADGVLVCFADDGCGMGADVLERAFDPFFTTKAVGEGTGLGLAISYQIVHAHHGEIQLESAPGKGTLVRVYLPVEGPPEASEGETQTDAPVGR